MKGEENNFWEACGVFVGVVIVLRILALVVNRLAR